MKNLRCLKKLFSIVLLATLTLPLQAVGTEDIWSAKVLSVVDGDTLKINYKGKQESVRLIGIDAPESRPNKKAKNDAQRSGEDLKTITAMGKVATNYVKNLLKPGDTVRIEFDVQRRDKYGRLLGYVYLPNGDMLNEEIVNIKRSGSGNGNTVFSFPPLDRIFSHANTELPMPGTIVF